MRLIKVSAPQGKGASVAQTAFSVGIEKASIYQSESVSAGGESKIKDVVDLQTSTPKGKRFVDALLAESFFNREEYSIEIRQPRSIISGESLRELTKPLVDPATDILEELWQYSHITFGWARFYRGLSIGLRTDSPENFDNHRRPFVFASFAASSRHRFRLLDAAAEISPSRFAGILNRDNLTCGGRRGSCGIFQPAGSIRRIYFAARNFSD